ELRLKVFPENSGDLSPLVALGPSDLQSLVLDNTKVGDADLAHVKGLTSLRSLNIRKRRVAGKRHPLIGKPLGDLKFTSLKGKQIDVSQYKGKVVLVDFWAMWCGPCIGELPNVKNTYDNYHEDGFEIIGINLDRDRTRLEEFIGKRNMPWPQHFDGKGWKNEIAVRFDIHSIPATFLLDREGIVRYANLRGSALEHAVEDLLRGPLIPDAQITDAGMAHLKGLTSLETLRLDNTQVGDEGLAYLKGLTSLKVLYLADTQVTDAGLAHIGELTTLHKLCVGRTQVSDAGLEHLNGLTSLHDLCVGSTKVTDSGLEHLKALTKLQKLNLVGTKVSKAGIRELKRSLPNCRISEPAAPKARRAAKSRLARGLERFGEADMPFHLRVLIAVIAIPIVSFLLAVFLRLSAGWVAKFKIPYWTAYKIAIVAALVNFVIGIPFDILGTLWAEFLNLVVSFFVQSAIYGTMIKYPETNESIGYGKGLLISLILLLIGIVLACVIGFCVFILMFGFMYSNFKSF
ncbi:MAG: TlpA family protein disulfide reductase, partial [Planctomycetota bacterium]